MNRRGSVALWVMMAGMILMMLALSVMARQMTSYQATISSENRLRAHYLAESGMEMALWQLNEWVEEGVESYRESPGTQSPEPWVRQYLVSRLYLLNDFDTHPLDRPFPLLTTPHQIRMKAELCIEGTQLTVTVEGRCENARITRQALLEMPVATPIQGGGGEYARWKLTPLRLVSLRQIEPYWLHD